MRFDLLPGTDGVVRFPVERRARPTLARAEELAPRSDLADAMADERAGDEDRPDILAQAAGAFTQLAEALEFAMGQDAALAHLRTLMEAQVAQACTLGWQYRDAETAAVEAWERHKAARASGAPASALHGPSEEVRCTRVLWTERALAARAVTDAALGAQAALDCHERGETWHRRTGNEAGQMLIELERAARARRDTPA